MCRRRRTADYAHYTATQRTPERGKSPCKQRMNPSGRAWFGGLVAAWPTNSANCQSPARGASDNTHTPACRGDGTSVRTVTDPNPVLEANLKAIARRDPALADRIRDAAPAPIDFAPSKAGPLWGALDAAGRPLALASKYDPDAEADKLVAAIDHQKTACTVVLGFAMGYHAKRAFDGMKGTGLLIVHEPDLGLLRAVLGRVDHSAWLGAEQVLLCDDTVDRAALTGKIERLSALVTQGTQLLTHPASRRLHGEALGSFAQMVTDILAYCRTNVATALVNASRTCRNLAANLGPYAAGATVNELHNAAQGFPAVLVSAGPSLVKNVGLLRDPAVRDNVVVIAVQTALRPLLDRGIRPDFVTALDYSPICTRFYEGLPELPDVTLVVEAKANAAILDAYPGPTRVCHAPWLDRLLGEHARPIVPMKPGATVAHLSLYLAQHLGADPVMMIGQDLGFSDGLYYAPGTAVHRVWSAELNPFNTIEMMEWQRIVRMKGNLSRHEDIHGQPIFSDEQMVTYLKQFERDFAELKALGRTIIDATEGGMPKQHTRVMALADALAAHATRPRPVLPIPPVGLDPHRLALADQMLSLRVRQVNQVQQASREAIRLLRQMKAHQRDGRRMKQLFDKLTRHQQRVHSELADAFALVSTLNTLGTFKRQRADRMIGQAGGDAYERQAAQIDRDIENLDLAVQAADETLDILHDARSRLDVVLAHSRASKPEAVAA